MSEVTAEYGNSPVVTSPGVEHEHMANCLSQLDGTLYITEGCQLGRCMLQGGGFEDFRRTSQVLGAQSRRLEGFAVVMHFSRWEVVGVFRRTSQILQPRSVVGGAPEPKGKRVQVGHVRRTSQADEEGTTE